MHVLLTTFRTDKSDEITDGGLEAVADSGAGGNSQQCLPPYPSRIVRPLNSVPSTIQEMLND